MPTNSTRSLTRSTELIAQNSKEPQRCGSFFVYAFIGEDDKSFGFFLGAMRASHLTDILRGTANNNTLYIVWIYSREGPSSPSPCTMQ